MGAESEAALTKPATGFIHLRWPRALWLIAIGAVCFHAAYLPAAPSALAFGTIGYLICLVQLARLRTPRQCFYFGLAMGFICFAPQLECFWRIFGPAAIMLWLILAFWIGLFVVLSHHTLARLKLKWAVLLIPFLWTGLEYFRSELYYLKFSWLNIGYAWSQLPLVPLGSLGMYGVGFVVAIVAAVHLLSCWRWVDQSLTAKFVILVVVAMVAKFLIFPVGSGRGLGGPSVVMAGVQLEFPTIDDVRRELNRLLTAQTNMALSPGSVATNFDLVVLSEYTLEVEPPKVLKDWCRDNQKFMIVGGKDHAPGTNYLNTAYVISTNGEVVFKQVKSVPIQFFKDGLPAKTQALWDSPWGKIGICICYDLSYTRVTDELVRQGAQMLIVPTMDVADWGAHQHELHARVAPVRAVEYRIPIFRVASSGISQGVTRNGRVAASAPMGGDGETIFYETRLDPRRQGRLPLDRWLAPFCVVVTMGFVVWLAVLKIRERKKIPTTLTDHGT